MQLVGIANCIGDISDGQPGQLQKLSGLDHTVVEQEFLGGLSQGFLENLPEIAAVQTAGGGDILDGDIVLEILLHIGQGFLDIEVPEPAGLRGRHVHGGTGQKV